jgi:hypothetical protein
MHCVGITAKMCRGVWSVTAFKGRRSLKFGFPEGNGISRFCKNRVGANAPTGRILIGGSAKGLTLCPGLLFSGKHLDAVVVGIRDEDISPVVDAQLGRII